MMDDAQHPIDEWSLGTAPRRRPMTLERTRRFWARVLDTAGARLAYRLVTPAGGS